MSIVKEIINEDILLCKKIKAKKCKHGVQTQYCFDCKGSRICEHNNNINGCKDCASNGIKNGICEHNISRTVCQLGCGGSRICEHGQQKQYCRLGCGGTAYCEHDKRKARCVICHSENRCDHGNPKERCKQCGTGYCEHQKRKDSCIDCSPQLFCTHNKLNYNCKLCEGSRYCIHKIRKDCCKDCGGSALCKKEYCETSKHKKCDGLCLRHYVEENPDTEFTKRYRTKELDIVNFVREQFNEYLWIHNKQIEGGISKRRPDLLMITEDQAIIIEIDENKHQSYDCICENKRLVQIYQDLNYKSVVFIRFNPDDYIDSQGNNITSCWNNGNKLTSCSIKKCKVQEWNDRKQILKEQIEYWLSNKTEKAIEVIQLFFDLTF